MNRRNALGTIGTGLLPGLATAAPSVAKTGPKRVVFFLQNQGFDPLTCIPKGLAIINKQHCWVQ